MAAMARIHFLDVNSTENPHPRFFRSRSLVAYGLQGANRHIRLIVEPLSTMNMLVT
jgi:hypothetical protein